ncbi:hypothetical protein FB45DRAFT_1002099 [Roridomyces roridus]|uniref:Uncharacterized protein n=1 Tax=Roridomyces roridus TaxID=1738132 RepID=A0AAD7BYP2_9AGAR|nr:hypothetical protein FB45DRAFT_1002099 [Roridomyces roridus]
MTMDYYNARRIPSFYSPASSPLESPLHGVVPSLQLLENKKQLCHRLIDGQLPNMPVGFPFHHVMDAYGNPRLSHDPFEFWERLDFNSRCSGHLSACISFTPAARDSDYSKREYFSWCVTMAKLDLRPFTRGPPPKAPVAHVRVDPEVMRSSYGRRIESDPNIILRALSTSLELGLLVTIMFEENTSGAGNWSKYRNVVFVGTANNGRRSILFNAGSFRIR